MKKNYIYILLTIFIVSLTIMSSVLAWKLMESKVNKKPNVGENVSETVNNKEENESNNAKTNDTDILLSAIGDCTIGYDDNFGYSNSFNDLYDKNGPDFFFSGVKQVLSNDDLTIANLETTFTEATVKNPKKYNFKAPPSYVDILTRGSIEVVNVANNHTYDYNEVGYQDTLKTLEKAGIPYFGYDYTYVYQKNDIKLGLGGIYCIEDRNCTKKIDKVLNILKKQDVEAIILSFHWGIEYDYDQSSIQTYLAHYAIDNGVDLVLGHHPHVLQGIELYKNKYIVYSLSNFSFGGNKNSRDKDSMIFQMKMIFSNKTLTNTNISVLPVRISTYDNRNDYRPRLVEGEEKIRILKKIQTYSVGVNLI